MVKILAALSILNSSGASPGATEKVAVLVARATCSGASHSSAIMDLKPSTDERLTDAELCISYPHFTRHRRKFIQTFNLVQIS